MTKTKRKSKGGIKAAIHEIAGGLHCVGMIDKQTMRRFDDSCLTPIHAFSPSEIKALREREEVSQTVFASYLNVTKDSVSKWERGKKKPAGPSLKLLSLVERKGLEAIA
jgi:putative transcriptional regulator